VKVTAAIARQLQLLCADFEDTERLAIGLTTLGASVVAAVPSCVSVSVTLGVVGSVVPVTIGIRSAVAGPVLASLAVPRSLLDPADIVLFQASQSGAFLLLAADLAAALDPSQPLRIDEHLDTEIDATAGGLAVSMDNLSAVHRAVGVLIDRGLLPEDAYAELTRQARQDGTDLPSASRLLLDSIYPSPVIVGDLPPLHDRWVPTQPKEPG
jgi:hypothetical protein